MARAPHPPRLPIRRQARPTAVAEVYLGPTGLSRSDWYDVDHAPPPAPAPPGVPVAQLFVDDFRRPVRSELLEFRDPEGRRVFHHRGDSWKAGTSREFKRDPFTALRTIGPGLFFLRSSELRRLGEYPGDWAELTDEGLVELLGQADLHSR